MMTESPMNLYQAGDWTKRLIRQLSKSKRIPPTRPRDFSWPNYPVSPAIWIAPIGNSIRFRTRIASAALTVALIRQLIRAELSRRECFAERRVPEFIGQPSTCLQSRLRALIGASRWGY